jgi:hypothetical protein
MFDIFYEGLLKENTMLEEKYTKEFIKERRVARGEGVLTQAELTRQLGYPNPSFVAAFEIGKVKCPESCYEDLCLLLQDVTMFDLYVHQLIHFHPEKYEIMKSGFFGMAAKSKNKPF